MRPPVLVLTNLRDIGVDPVIDELSERADVTRINAEQLLTQPPSPWELGTGDRDARAVWWRQFELPFESDSSPSLAEVEGLLVQRAQWRAWLSTISAQGRWMNPLWAARRAEDKIGQLRLALEVGFDVPATTVVADAGQAAAFASRTGPCIVKTLASGYFEFSKRGFVYTTDLADEILDTPGWREQPVLIQQRIQGAHVRGVVIGKRTFAAEAQSDILDWRLDDNLEWRELELPAPLTGQCVDYLARAGLEYCAFDFIRSGASFWFLEGNQAGEWAFIDRHIDLGMSHAIAEHLIEMAQG